MIVSPDDPLALADERVASPARLAAAHRSGLLNSPPEESFDALTRLATSLIGAPVSFLSISGADRDVYKSQFGFPEPLASGRQMTGRTFCHYALTSDAPLVIEDTHADALWRAVPTVDSMGIRAYLGVPLIVDGEAIGSLCVVDSVPRAWTPLQIDTLSQLAESAGREVQLRNALKDSRAETLRANDLARTKEELVAVVVHDLRSPMQVIGACSTLMRREPNPAIQDHTVRIDGALASMKSLVDDLLSSPVEGDTPHRHAAATAVKGLIDDAARTMATLAERAGMRVQVASTSQSSVWVDYAHILRVLCNLIGNAIKFCPAGSTVWLMAVDVNDDVVLSVTDDGPGMSKEDQARAFERGWQGVGGREHADGSGLGLFIVRQLIELNAGKVWMSGDAGQGIEVSVQLPRVRTAQRLAR